MIPEHSEQTVEKVDRRRSGRGKGRNPGANPRGKPRLGEIKPQRNKTAWVKALKKDAKIFAKRAVVKIQWSMRNLNTEQRRAVDHIESLWDRLEDETLGLIQEMEEHILIECREATSEDDGRLAANGAGQSAEAETEIKEKEKT